MPFVQCQVVADTGLLGVQRGAAQLFVRDNLSSGRLDERRAAKEDRAFLVHHDDFVTH